MAEWLNIAAADEFPPDSFRTLDCEGTPIAVFNVGGNYYAIEDCCTHEAETLSDGPLEGLEIVCPRHLARFSLETGAALEPPAYEPVTTFPVRIWNGMVQVRDDRIA